MKKKLLILMALLIFMMPIFANLNQAQAVPVASKVVSAAGKKIAKEAIKDTAINMTMTFAMDYKYVPKDQRKPKAGFEMICLPENKKPAGECSKVMEVKKLTSTDKKELGKVVEKNLDKKIAGGLGSKKWFKFLDWLIPIWLVGLGFAVVDYAIDGDVSSLFDEVAFDSLAEKGFIYTPNKPQSGGGEVGRPPQPSNPNPMPPPPVPEVPVEPIDINEYVNCNGVPNCFKVSLGSYSYYKALFFEINDGLSGEAFFVQDNGEMYKVSNQTSFALGFRQDSSTQNKLGVYMLSYNGGSPGSSGSQMFSPLAKFNDTFRQFYVNSTWYYNYPDLVYETMISYLPAFKDRIVFVPNIMPESEPIPQYDQLEIPLINKPGTSIPVIAPGAFPMEETGSGIVVYPYTKPDGTTGYRTEDGKDIHEDNVTVKDPTITENPDGSTTVEKAPTPENPNPKPETKPPIEPPEETFPEGETCSNSLKKPNFKPLTSAITTSFPFSIPWDLKRGFDAAFSEIGANKPEFDYVFNFNGEEKKWSISVPSYFDKWVSFSKAFLLIVFDVSLLYMIYRFTKGGD